MLLAPCSRLQTVPAGPTGPVPPGGLVLRCSAEFICSAVFCFVFFGICDIFLRHVFPGLDGVFFLRLQNISVIAAFCRHRVFSFFLSRSFCVFVCFWFG